MQVRKDVPEEAIFALWSEKCRGIDKVKLKGSQLGRNEDKSLLAEGAASVKNEKKKTLKEI